MLIAKILLTSKYAKSDNVKKNLKLIGSVIQSIIKDYFNSKLLSQSKYINFTLTMFIEGPNDNDDGVSKNLYSSA